VKKGRIVAALVCASAGFSSMALAQGSPGWTGGTPDGHGGPNQHPANQGPANQGPSNQRPSNQGPSNQGPLLGHNGAGQRDPGWQGDQGNDHRGNGRPPVQQQAQGDPRGGPRDWRRGDRLPSDYRNRQYVVDDYRGYGLHQPPRGYHWVGVNGDYALVGITSGVIASTQLSSR
jgi:Ni/Co efflux regulator RcnB